MSEDLKQENLNQKPGETSVSTEAEMGGSEEEKKGEEWADMLALKEEEVKQLQDRVLRLAAEMENTRKRLEREKSDGICYANESLIRELLPVIDNLERAVEHAEKDADAKSLLEGVRMTLKSFGDVLSKYGCTPFESVGQAFDPNYHEAVMQQISGEHAEKTVLAEFQKGYKLHDRLLRPASVVVSKAPEEEESVG